MLVRSVGGICVLGGVLSERDMELVQLIPVDALEAPKLLLAFWTDVEENMSDYTLSGQACTEYGPLGGFNDGPLPTAQYPEVPADGTEYAHEILAMVKDDNYLYEYTSGEAHSRVG